MKRYLFLLLILFSSFIKAAEISNTNSYYGQIQGVSVGFYTHVAIGFPTGQTCLGSSIAVLLTSNPKYKEILSLFLLSETSKQSVNIFQPSAQTISFPGGGTYCVVTEAALGNFTLWASP
ncbi:MAG: hypothetical protein K2Q15_03520 [Burkholderiales bacterium]|nr:hypothetical protein [Burkholderiales bacterium]